MSKQIKDIILSDEQQKFITIALSGKNILVDACIGSGKTTSIQTLCDIYLTTTNILYLTYNRLLKIDAKSKIKNFNATVNNYNGFVWQTFNEQNIHQPAVQEQIQTFNRIKPKIEFFDVLIIDEYQDIDQEIADMLLYIKSTNPKMQIIAVGDMEQKIYDKTTLNVVEFISSFLGEYTKLAFTLCFRLSKDLAAKLGRIWKKPIVGVNNNCSVIEMSQDEVVSFLAECEPADILCLEARTGALSETLNKLERQHSYKFNKNTVFASIADDGNRSSTPKTTSAIFTTFDSSKGLERKICIVFDYDEDYWQVRAGKPQQSYEILRNIFCVAASRGKDKIIFVKTDHAILSEKTLSTPSKFKNIFDKFSISAMFDFKRKEDIEKAYFLLEIKDISDKSDMSEIYIKNTDGLIDLSPCIGIYQEAVFFDNYDINRAIELKVEVDKDQEYLWAKEKKKKRSLDEKILFLVSLETKQSRYIEQVIKPFVSEKEKKQIIERLQTVFQRTENAQVVCEIMFANYKDGNKSFSAVGFADVVKNNIIYELKFVSELSHEHFLQCACYIIALKLEKGILINTRNNTKYEIKINDRQTFLDAVTNAITKGYLDKYVAGKDRFAE